MKKLLLAAGLCSLIVTGCAKPAETTVTAAQLEEYEAYYNLTSNNVNYIENSDHFDLSAEMAQVSDGSYRYYVICDQPKMAMYDVNMFVVEDDIRYEDADKMMPSYGLFEDAVSMIPNQINSEDGYVKGISVSGTTDKDEVNLKILVLWHNVNNTKTYREFLQRTVSVVKEDAE